MWQPTFIKTCYLVYRGRKLNTKSTEGAKGTKEAQMGAGQPYHIVKDVDPVDLFVDGALQLIIGPLVSKVIFFRSLGPDPEQKVEVREPAVRLAIPTPSLLEMAVFILQQAHANRDVIIGNMEQQNVKFREALLKLNVDKTE